MNKIEDRPPLFLKTTRSLTLSKLADTRRRKPHSPRMKPRLPAAAGAVARIGRDEQRNGGDEQRHRDLA
jgi:hypothetical protein